MNKIFSARVLNPYRAKGKRYNWLRGHTGVDLAFNYNPLLSPITGTVVAITHQKEMGNCVYIIDAYNNYHVFAHLSKVYVVLHQKVKRGNTIAQTGNTGTATSGPHLHYEIVTVEPKNAIDRIMVRKELIFKGYNTDPIPYLKKLYENYGIDWKTGEPTLNK